MSVCVFNYLSYSEYSDLFIVAAFSSKSFSDKTSLLLTNSYLLTFRDDQAEILTISLSKLY